MELIIGRQEEIATLNVLKNSKKSEFVAVYGRRRVGKTFLIRNVFTEPFNFQLSGVANVGLKQHLTNFHNAFLKINPDESPKSPPDDWFEAFNRLSLLLEKQTSSKKVIFLDEPTIGLDVLAAAKLRDFLKIHNQKEKFSPQRRHARN